MLLSWQNFFQTLKKGCLDGVDFVECDAIPMEDMFTPFQRHCKEPFYATALDFAHVVTEGHLDDREIVERPTENRVFHWPKRRKCRKGFRRHV